VLRTGQKLWTRQSCRSIH